MHTDIKYSGADGAKRAQALKDIEGWFGKERMVTFEASVKAIQESDEPMNRTNFVMTVWFGGVQGYPVQVWADKLGIPAYTEAEIAANESQG